MRSFNGQRNGELLWINHNVRAFHQAAHLASANKLPCARQTQVITCLPCCSWFPGLCQELLAMADSQHCQKMHFPELKQSPVTMEHSVCPPPLEACPKSGGCARSCGGSWETANAGLRQLRPYCLHGDRAPAPPQGAQTEPPQSCAAGSRKQSLGYPGTWLWKQRK